MIKWLSQYVRWDTVAWLVLISVGTVLELLGVFKSHFSTFTALIRSTIPVWVRIIVIGLLFYHFVIQK